jgi:protein SCO1/2
VTSVPALLAALVSTYGTQAPVGTPTAPPAVLAQVDVEEKLGDHVPMDVSFTDATGRTGPLRSFVSGKRPIVMTLVYYKCPMLCSLVLGNLVKGMAGLATSNWRLGKDYDAVTVSFDPNDSRYDAGERQHGYLQSLGYGEAAQWPFLIGTPGDVRAVTESVGFHYAYDRQTGQYAHAAVVVVLAPDGKVSRYLYGIDFPPKQLKLALFEASAGRAGTAFERVLLTCYRYNPATRRYGMVAMRVMRAGGLIVMLTLFGMLALFWRREFLGRRGRVA